MMPPHVSSGQAPAESVAFGYHRHHHYHRQHRHHHYRPLPPLPPSPPSLPLQALAESVAFGARTKEGLFLQEAARAVLKMRQAVIAVGDGDWTSEQREAVEQVVQASVPLHPEVPELQQAAERVAVRAQVRDIVMLLEQSIAVLHHEALKMALMQADAVGKEAMVAYAALQSTAASLDSKLDAIRGALRSGIKEVSLQQLRPALADAEQIGLSHYEQPPAAMLAVNIERVVGRAQAVLAELHPQLMATVLGEADSFSLVTPEIDQIRAYLAMPAEKFLSEQLKVRRAVAAARAATRAALRAVARPLHDT